MKKVDVLLFYLDNNKSNFISKISQVVPAIMLEPFFKQHDSTPNNILAQELTAYFDQNKLWQKLMNLKFQYNQLANNWTTEPEMKNQIFLANGVKPDNSDNFLDFEKSAIVQEKDFWTGLGDFFGGSTEGGTSTTTTTTKTTNAILIIGVIFGLVAAIYVIIKFVS